jgi:hypothetical protein
MAPRLNEDIASVEWDDVSAFPLLVSEIKKLKYPSPVFTAKFCGLLAPCIFPIVDNEAMRNNFSTYKQCFRRAQDEWRETNAAVQNELVKELAQQIGTPFARYPVKCKAIELCMIGRAQKG